MQAIIRDNHSIQLDQVTQGSEEALVRWFSARAANAFYARRASGGNWDGWYRKYSVKHQRLALPYLAELKLCCKTHQIPLEINDLRPAPIYPAPQEDQITNTIVPGITMEEFQVRCLRVCCNEEIGLVSAVTGSGKTELMCALVKMFRCPTVIITEQIIVLNQIVERLEMRNVVHGNDIGLFCHGHMPEGNLVIVGSIQSISSPTKPKPDKIKVKEASAIRRCTEWAAKKTLDEQDQKMLYHIFPRVLADALYENPAGAKELKGTHLELLIEFCNVVEYHRMLHWYKTRIAKSREIQGYISDCDMLLIDEADLATSDQYNELVGKYFHGRRRYGFSGTPFDKNKPIRTLQLKENLGSIITEATRDEVQATERIIPIKPILIMIGPDKRQDVRTFDIAMKEEMIENVAFQDLVAKIPSSFPNDGTLILVDTSPIEPLGVALEQKIPNSKFIFGTTPQKQRDKYIELFERRELTCLIGSKILRRGLDLQGGVENLIIIGSGKSWSDFDQKVGRAVRVNARGWSRVFSFFFLTNKYLYKHSKESLKALISMGYEPKLVLDGITIDGKKFIKSNFYLPKREW